MYQIKLTKKQDSTIKKYVFKIFGINSKYFNRKLENSIIKTISDMDLTPKIVATDDITYKIEEFIENKGTIPHDLLMDPKLLTQISQILLE